MTMILITTQASVFLALRARGRKPFQGVNATAIDASKPAWGCLEASLEIVAAGTIKIACVKRLTECRSHQKAIQDNELDRICHLTLKHCAVSKV